jgi:hypothetical protein
MRFLLSAVISCPRLNFQHLLLSVTYILLSAEQLADTSIDTSLDHRTGLKWILEVPATFYRFYRISDDPLLATIYV